MSIPITIPVTARPTITANIFAGPYNTTTANRYDFTADASSPQTVLTMVQNTVYLIERACFSLDVPEGDFQRAIDSAISVPRIYFRTTKTNQLIFPRPQPFINYVDNLELMKFVPCDQKDDQLQVSFECILFQTPALVGITSLNAYLQLNIYEIQATDWVKYWNSPKNAQGKDLNLRGY